MESGAILYEVLLFLVLVPALAGSGLTKWAGDRFKRQGRSPPAVRALRIVISVIWISIAVWGLVLAFGPFSFFSTLTVSAVASIAITLSLQTTIQNVISGFMLLRGRFLRVGDVIQFSGVKGQVVSIGAITVVIKAQDGSLASVSNSNLLSGPFTNFTATTRLAGEY